jgi:UDP-N-acetylglucosamine enolpyruvyl transferase
MSASRKRNHLSRRGRSRRAVVHTSSTPIQNMSLAIPSELNNQSKGLAMGKLPPLPELDTFSVTGGGKLSGHVHISGAKNSALAVLAGSLCCSEEVRLTSLPDLVDVEMMLRVLGSLGVEVRQSGRDVVVNARGLACAQPCADSVQKIRASFFVIGALVARHGEATLALPGGCCIGARPVDIHLRGLQALGAKVEAR